MNNQQTFSLEATKHFEKVITALEQAAMNAANTAKETNTPLILYDKERGIQEIHIQQDSCSCTK